MNHNDRILWAALKSRPVNDLFTNEGCFQQPVQAGFWVALPIRLVLDQHTGCTPLSEPFEHLGESRLRAARSGDPSPTRSRQPGRISRFGRERVCVALVLLKELEHGG